MRDLKLEMLHACRRLLHAPGFALAAILTMSLGVSLAGVLFTIVNAILLPSLPIDTPETMIRAYTGEAGGDRRGATSVPDYRDFRTRTTAVLQDLAISAPQQLRLGNAASGQGIRGSLVSGNYFTLLGVPLELGRGIAPDEDIGIGAHPVVVLGYDLWHGRFNADRTIIGRRVALSGKDFEVIGVAGRAFTGTDPGQLTELWLPLTMQGAATGGESLGDFRDARMGNMIGRLRDGVPLEDADQLFTRVAAELAREYPEFNQYRSATVRGMIAARRLEADPARALALAFGVILIIHLIACGNLASLMLARGLNRQRETAIRLALGATRSNLVRQLMWEPLLLAGGAVLVGAFLARWGTDLMQSWTMFAGLRLQVDPVVIGSLGGFGALTAIIVGLTPALHAGKADVQSALKGTGPLGIDARSSSTNLVIGQLGLAVTMLFVSSMTARSLNALLQVDPGYPVDRLLFAHVTQTGDDFRSQEWQQTYATLMQQTRALPGVVSVSMTQVVPLSGDVMARPVTIPGYEYTPGEPHNVEFETIGPEYFATFGIPLREGRELGARDFLTAPNSEHSIVVNQAMARRFWPTQSAIGKEMLIGPLVMRVVGVVADTRTTKLSEVAQPRYYAGGLFGDFELVVRTAVPPAQLIEPVRGVINRLGDAVAPPRFQTGPDALDNSLSYPRRALEVSAGFGTLALLLSTLGLFGVLSLMVQQDRRELGIRLAIGARPAALARLVLRRSLRMIGLGVGLGIVGGLGAGQLARGLLFGVSPADPLAIVTTCLLLLLVGLLATAVPAWRASHTDPMEVLRAE